MLARRAEAGGDEHGAELVAVQGGGMRLVIGSRSFSEHALDVRNLDASVGSLDSIHL